VLSYFKVPIRYRIATQIERIVDFSSSFFPAIESIMQLPWNR